MEIDAPVPADEQWGLFIAESFKNFSTKSVFPSCDEAIETIRQIFQQTYFNKPKETDDQSSSCFYVKKIYQVLKYFYAEFPISLNRVNRLKIILDISISLFSEMRAKSNHRESIQSMEIMIQIASDRLNQITQGI